MSRSGVAGAGARSTLAWAVVGLLACVCLALYAVGAPRGIELTDEAFYTLHFRYWQDLNFNFSFFGAYLDGLFWLVRERIDAMRVVGALLIMVSSAVLCWQLAGYLRWRWSDLPTPPRRIVVVAAVLSLAHYAFMWTLRLPSYNTLAFAGSAITTALLLAWLRLPPRRAVLGFFYGVALGATAMGKVTTGALVAALHLAVLLVHWRDLTWRAVLQLVVVALAGVLLNVAYLTLRLPGWWQVVMDGLVFQRTMETRDLVLALRAVLWSLQREAPLPWLGAMGVLLIAQVVQARRAAGGGPVLFALNLGLLCAWMALTTTDRGGWLLLAGLAWLSLLVEVFAQRRWAGVVPWLVLAGVLFALPLLYSFGTNMALAEHSLMAATFPLLGLLCGLWSLRCAGRAGENTLAFGAGVLLLPALAAVAWPWLHAEQTYRLRTPLTQANVVLEGNPRYAGLRTDAQTAAALTSLLEALQAQGFRTGQPMVDLTGGHPGLVDVLGGEPVGVAWLLGNYPGSTAAAGVVVSGVEPARWQRTWLLTSDNAARRIDGWEKLLAQRLAGRCHERVMSLPFSPPHSAVRDAPGQPIELSVWRPLAACEAGGRYDR